ncbi:hypothetical protein [uncultured Microbacterium sp.]|uniref:hypothetical protein n=1 Tax=uncultured Microbacterium sp. TaxID=191216 RepID=UPI0035CAC314
MTASHALPRSLSARPTTIDRVLLAMAMRLERAAVARMQRRATGAVPAHARRRAEDVRRDAAATMHAGLLPR